MGSTVFTPMGWDAFGLPAENAALERRIDPQSWTASNIETMKKSFADLDLSLDWKAEINTSDKEYYKWTQWLFLLMFSKGLAYQKHALVNWDPVDQTVLANEQVDHKGRAERSGAEVEKRFMKQWFFKITDYAGRLHNDLHELDWPENVKQQQMNWILQQNGIFIHGEIFNAKTKQSGIEKVFISESDFLKMPLRLLVGTRHSLAKNWDLNHLKKGKRIYKLDNLFLKDPFFQNKIVPVFLSTDIPDQDAVLETSQEPRNSNISFDEWVKSKRAKTVTNYRLRDWLISRQRNWGTPIPIIHCQSCGPVPVPEKDLPVVLNSDNKSLEVECPKCGSMGVRETDTMDTFVDSSWYWARFTDPHNSSRIVDPKVANNMLPVDIYIGGIEHSILHLLYARFMGKFMTDNNIVNLPNGEPFSKLITVGMVKGKTLKDKSGRYYSESDCVSADKGLKSIKGTPITVGYEKMSKSKGNGVDPHKILDKYNSDVLRLYICSRVGMEDELRWDDSSIIGMSRWLNNCDKLIQDFENSIGSISCQDLENIPLQESQLKTVKKVTDCFLKNWNFHNAISALIIYFNNLKKSSVPWTDVSRQKEFVTFIQMMHPFSPNWTEKVMTRHNIPLKWPKN